jgi:hypothetical protein
MKKKYVAPESALLTLNFSENIAASGISETVISGGGSISFTHSDSINDCRKYYTGDMTAEVDETCSTFQDYWTNIRENKYEAIWWCYSPF